MAWNFGDILLTMLALFFWAALIWMFIGVFADIFRRRDLSGGAKAGWAFLIVVLPFLGVLIYLIARPAVVETDLPKGRKARRRPVHPTLGRRRDREGRQAAGRRGHHARRVRDDQGAGARSCVGQVAAGLS